MSYYAPYEKQTWEIEISDRDILSLRVLLAKVRENADHCRRQAYKNFHEKYGGPYVGGDPARNEFERECTDALEALQRLIEQLRDDKI